jgi:hypothetical protein
MIQSILACVDTVMLTWCPAFPSPPRWGSRLIVLGALLSPPLQAQELPDASAVIERVLEAYGGVDALAAIESYRMVGELRPSGGPLRSRRPGCSPGPTACASRSPILIRRNAACSTGRAVGANEAVACSRYPACCSLR